MCWSFLPCQISDIINGSWVITQKPAILPYVLLIDMADSPIKMIQANFGLNWPSGFRGEDFWKKTTDRGRMPSDGNSSHRWAKKYFPVNERVIGVCWFFLFSFFFICFVCLFVCFFNLGQWGMIFPLTLDRSS